jgi:hypothetical protein
MGASESCGGGVSATPAHSRAVSNLKIFQSHSVNSQTSQKENTHAPDFVEHEGEPLTLRFAPAYLFLYQPAATPRRVSRVKYEKDDVCLVDHFV